MVYQFVRGMQILGLVGDPRCSFARDRYLYHLRDATLYGFFSDGCRDEDRRMRFANVSIFINF